jgi:hypothetical protein
MGLRIYFNKSNVVHHFPSMGLDSLGSEALLKFECDLCGDQIEGVDPKAMSLDITKIKSVFCNHGFFCSQECSNLFHEQHDGPDLEITMGKKNVH